MRFILTGRIKPYVRTTRRGKWVNPQAIEYGECIVAMGLQLKAQMARNGWHMLPPRTPLKMHATFMLSDRLHCQDVDNQFKALADCAQGIVFANDLWLDEISAARCLGDEDVTILEVDVL